MSSLHLSLLAAALLATACATDDFSYDLDDEEGVVDGGKADGASAVNIEWCKEAAGDYARQLYNDFEDVELLDTTVAKVVGGGSGYLWIQTDSTGGGRQSTDIILMSTDCYPIGSKYTVLDYKAAVYFARRAATVTQAKVEAEWDFDRILSAELRWPITSAGVTVDVKVLDLGFDEGTFAVSISRSGKIKSIVQTGTFTP